MPSCRQLKRKLATAANRLSHPRLENLQKMSKGPSDLSAYRFHLFNHSGYIYSASSSSLLLRSAPDTARVLCWSFTPKRHRQLQAKDLPTVSMWRLKRDSNPRPFGRKASNLSISHHVPTRFTSDN